MKNKINILFACLFALNLIICCDARSAIKKKYYPDGNLHSKIKYNEKGQKHGEMEVYRKDGSILQVVRYRDGVKRHVDYYHQNGRISQSIDYKDGKANGIMKAYSEEGHLVQEIPYKDGEIHGVAKEYYPDTGLLYTESPYENGRPVGVQVYYDQEGRVTRRDDSTR